MAANKNASRRTLESDPARVDAPTASTLAYRDLPPLDSDILAPAKVRIKGATAFTQSAEAHLAATSCRCDRALESDRAWLADPDGRASE